MAKLVVHFSNKIMTGPLYSQNEKSYENHGSKLLRIFSKTDPETLGVEVVMVNDGREIVFVFDGKCEKKDCSLKVVALADGSGLAAEISGTYEVKLRVGVAPSLREYGDNLDLRIRAITSNGGEWSGFISYVAGIPEPTARLHTYVDVMPKIQGMVSRR